MKRVVFTLFVTKSILNLNIVLNAGIKNIYFVESDFNKLINIVILTKIF